MGAIFSASALVVKLKAAGSPRLPDKISLLVLNDENSTHSKRVDRDYNDRTDKEEDQNLTNYLFNRIHIPHSFLNHPVSNSVNPVDDSDNDKSHNNHQHAHRVGKAELLC